MDDFFHLPPIEFVADQHNLASHWQADECLTNLLLCTMDRDCWWPEIFESYDMYAFTIGYLK